MVSKILFPGTSLVLTSFPESSLLLRERRILSRGKREKPGNEVGQ